MYAITVDNDKLKRMGGGAGWFHIFDRWNIYANSTEMDRIEHLTLYNITGKAEECRGYSSEYQSALSCKSYGVLPSYIVSSGLYFVDDKGGLKITSRNM